MGNYKPGVKYIYESPDGGETVYARKFGAPDSEKFMIGQSLRAKEQIERRMWAEIYEKRNLTPALTEAVEKCIIIYKLSEDYNDGI